MKPPESKYSILGQRSQDAKGSKELIEATRSEREQ